MFHKKLYDRIKDIENRQYYALRKDVDTLLVQMNLLLDHLNVHVEKVPAKTLLVENE